MHSIRLVLVVTRGNHTPRRALVTHCTRLGYDAPRHQLLAEPWKNHRRIGQYGIRQARGGGTAMEPC